MSRSQLTAEQKLSLVEDILGEISTAANSIRSMAYDLPSELDNTSLVTMAEKIGWMGDLGLTHISGSPQVLGDAENWFMPPRYADKRVKMGL